MPQAERALAPVPLAPPPLPAQLRLRDDLVIVEQQQRGQPYFVVKDPRSGKFAGFNAAAHALLISLRRETPTAAFRAQHAARGPAIEAFLARIAGLGFLDGTSAALPAAIPPPSGWRPPHPAVLWLLTRIQNIRVNPLHIRLVTVDPTRALNRLSAVGRAAFSRVALVFVLALLVSSFVLISRAPQRFINSFIIFGYFQSWIIIWPLMAAATVMHEFAHALACRRFGGQCREMGFVLYLFNLRCYTNVSDSWLFPRRRDRIAVSLGGVYLESFLFTIAIGAWYYTHPFGTGNAIAFISAVVLGSRVLFNVFPFLRLDGYFVVSDLLEIRNLRTRAFAALVALIPRWGRAWRLPPSTPRRDRAVLPIYGFLSLISAAGFIGFALRGMYIPLSRSPFRMVIFLTVCCMVALAVVVSTRRTLLELKAGRRS